MGSSLPNGVVFAQARGESVTATLTSPGGRTLQASGVLLDLAPTVVGTEPLTTNLAVVNNLWSFAKNEKLFRRARSVEKRKSYRRSADAHIETAVKIAALVDLRGTALRTGWCSGCFTRSEHVRLRTDFGAVRAYLCESCGSPTLPCAAPSCPHMATRGFGSFRVPRFCAEHRHDIPGFEKAALTVSTIAQYESLLAFEGRNLARGSRLAISSVLVAGTVSTAGVMAAPAIGGAVGSLVGGYSGAAASSYGLALLGGGSLATGGLGMAGGTAAIAVTGAALGGALGSSVTSAYIGEDKSFRIEKIQHGHGVSVLVASGFLTEGKDSASDWRELVLATYPDSSIYRVHWGSKELRDLGAALSRDRGRWAVTTAAKKFAVRATKAGAEKLGPIGAAVLAAEVARNPWHTALVRADRTGIALAGVLARVDEPGYVLVGHSLGARVMVSAAEALALRGSTIRVESVHLLGAAVGTKRDWHQLASSVTGAVHNYFSTNDDVLRYAYSMAQAGRQAIGLRGIPSGLPSIKNHNVSQRVSGHRRYLGNVRLASARGGLK